MHIRQTQETVIAALILDKIILLQSREFPPVRIDSDIPSATGGLVKAR